MRYIDHINSKSAFERGESREIQSMGKLTGLRKPTVWDFSGTARELTGSSRPAASALTPIS